MTGSDLYFETMALAVVKDGLDVGWRGGDAGGRDLVCSSGKGHNHIPGRGHSIAAKPGRKEKGTAL